MKLKEESLLWAIKHLSKENDTDLFPKPVEIKVIHEMQDGLLNKLKDLDLGNYNWHASRRFVIPKSDLSYRIATQLDPIDSIIFSAIIYEYGNLIEDKRIPISDNKVFSYRFKPLEDGTLYSNSTAWTDFWQSNLNKSKDYKYVAYLDIADFYNQIYHHVVDNQLINVGFPNQIKKKVVDLLESVTQTVSRGIPVGPHASHLIAELTLIPIDQSLLLRNYEFNRYADDIAIFCNSEEEARVIVYQLAGILDKQQRLILQRQKSKIYHIGEFQQICELMLKDNPLNELEEKITVVLRKHSGGNPYTKVSYVVLSPEEQELFNKERIESLIKEYLDNDNPNFPRLRWLYRRLIQSGTTHAIEFSIKNMDKLIPAISDVCHYLISVADGCEKDWKIIGEDVLNLLDKELIKSNEFFQISLLNLFVNNPRLNHFDKLIEIYKTSSDNIRRKVIFSAFSAKADAWIRELKEECPKFDAWNKRALIIACSRLPKDEKEHFLKYVKRYLQPTDYLEIILIDWAIKQ